MRIYLLLSLFLVVHFGTAEPPPTNNPKSEASTQDEDPFVEEDGEDAPFEFSESDAFHDTHSPHAGSHQEHMSHLHDGEYRPNSTAVSTEEEDSEEQEEIEYDVPLDEQRKMEESAHEHMHETEGEEEEEDEAEEMTTSPSSPAPSSSTTPKPVPMSRPIPEPEPEPTPISAVSPLPDFRPIPLPEPAIKFDNIKNEDYGTDEADSEKPDAIDNEVIEQLVNTFLNTGSAVNKTAVAEPKFVNSAAQRLVNSSPYWSDKTLKPPSSIKDEAEARAWIDGYYKEAQKVLYQVTTSGWLYFTSISPNTRKALAEAQDVMSRFVKSTAKQAKQFDATGMPEDIQKQLNFISFEGMNALTTKDYRAFTSAQDHINQQISESLTCEKGLKPPCTLKKIDISAIFNADERADHLQYLWSSFVRNVARLKPHYKKILDYTNSAAKLNGFPDGGAMWRSALDLSSKNVPAKIDLKQTTEDIYSKILPFYKQLHAYIRRQIAGIYSNPDGLTRDGPIPAHLFGSTEGGDWSFHYEATKPFQMDDFIPEDMMEAMQAQNFTSKTLFIKAYRYFKSVGFPSLPKTFWTNSVFQRVWTKDMLCEPAAAFDMRDGKDFRVKACAQIGAPDFKQAHSLLAQVYYQYLYRSQPLAFRESASPTINTAIAEVFSHLASNPNYLYSQQLIVAENLEPKPESTVNRLYREALENIATIPFALTADKWRYEIMEKTIKDNEWNAHWWRLRRQFEGVKAPVEPPNVAHVDAFMHTQINQVHSPAVRKLISYVVQFQILKSLCPPETELSEGCILSEDTTVKLRETMSKGSSIDWLKALEMLTGQGQLNAEPLLEYFAPLIDWLNKQNTESQVVIGWDGKGTPFQQSEIPVLENTGKGSSGIFSQDRVAFPGGECSNGEDCLLDSHCDGKTCVCDDGLFTLKLDNTVSCVSSNPMESGFIGGDGEFIGVNLVPSETTTEESNTTTTTTTQKSRRSASTLSLFIILLIPLILAYRI